MQTAKVLRLVSAAAVAGLFVGLSATRVAAQDRPAGCCTATPPPVPRGFFPEPRPLTEIIDLIINNSGQRGEPKDGFYPKTDAVMPDAGWIKVGPGYRRRVGRALFDASASVSSRRFVSAELRAEFAVSRWLDAGVQGLRQDLTQVGFFGLGPHSLQSDRSQYRLRASDTTAYVIARAGDAFSIAARVGLLGQPRVLSPTGWHNPGSPDTRTIFSETSAPGLTHQSRLEHADVAVVIDTLNHSGHPTSGGLIRVGASRFFDRDRRQQSFDRFDLSAAEYLPLSPVWTIALGQSASMADPRPGSLVPFYLLPSLGGDSGLRGYDNDRFRDRAAALVNVESRWAILAHLDAVLLADIGDVAPRARSLRWVDRKTAYGFGVRLHTGESTLLRLDAARSSEGWRFLFELTDSLSFRTLKRWATIVPILP